jgi:hypothetical protein
MQPTASAVGKNRTHGFLTPRLKPWAKFKGERPVNIFGVNNRNINSENVNALKISSLIGCFLIGKKLLAAEQLAEGFTGFSGKKNPNNRWDLIFGR